MAHECASAMGLRSTRSRPPTSAYHLRAHCPYQAVYGVSVKAQPIEITRRIKMVRYVIMRLYANNLKPGHHDRNSVA
jgi:hypothetical protein